LLTEEADVKPARDAAVVKASEIVSKTAKNRIGHEQPFWPALHSLKRLSARNVEIRRSSKPEGADRANQV
jgi:hypothetical protein